jgi:hypothetical protein
MIPRTSHDNSLAAQGYECRIDVLICREYARGADAYYRFSARYFRSRAVTLA